MSFMYSIREFSSSRWNPDEPITAEVVVAVAAAKRRRRRRRRRRNWSLETLSMVVAARRRRSWNWSLETLLVKFCWTAGNWKNFYFSNSPPLKIINRFLILKDKPTFSQSFLKKKN